MEKRQKDGNLFSFDNQTVTRKSFYSHNNAPETSIQALILIFIFSLCTNSSPLRASRWPCEPLVGFGPEGCRALATGRWCRSEVTVGRSRANAEGSTHSWVSEVILVSSHLKSDKTNNNTDTRINIVELLKVQHLSNNLHLDSETLLAQDCLKTVDSFL